MRLRLAIVVCTAWVLAGAFGAQAAASTFGLKGGASLAQFKYDPDVESPGMERLLGFGGGVTLGFALAPYLSLDIDGMYMMKGAHWKTSLLQETSERDWKSGYAIVSPVLRLRVPGGALAPYALAGGEVGYLLSAKVTTSGAGEADGEEDVKDECESLDYGFVLGAGLEIPNPTGVGIFVEARYVRGLADIAKGAADQGTLADADELKVMNEALYFMAGVRL
jgi:hypothetical protein